jgi:hypothetical protein
MTSMLVFAIAFAVGCLSGVVIALWLPRRRPARSHRTLSFWRLPDEESATAQRVARR